MMTHAKILREGDFKKKKNAKIIGVNNGLYPLRQKHCCPSVEPQQVEVDNYAETE